MKKRFSEEQIIGFLRETEAGMPLKFGGMSVPQARRLKELETENAPAEEAVGRAGPRERGDQGRPAKKW